jgi:hypothetical protein
MPYPTVDGPYGLIPVNLIGGQVFASAARSIPIATNSSTAIFFGDVVRLGSTGTLEKDVGTNVATPIGVFLGCTYTDPVFGKTFRQFYPGTTNITDVVAFVQDDPDALYKVAVVSAGVTIGTITRANVGENTALVQNAGSTVNGDSRVAVSATCATASTLPIRIIDVVPDTSPAGFPGSFTEVIVKWNQGMHPYYNPTGV